MPTIPLALIPSLHVGRDGWRNWASIQVRHRVDASREAVRQRHIEHVVGGLTRSISGAACVVKDRDFEPTQAGLVRGQDVETAARIVFAIQREIIFEYKDGQLRRGIRAGLRVNLHRGLPGTDRSTTHAVAAGTCCNAVGGAIGRACITSLEWLCRVPWQHLDPNRRYYISVLPGDAAEPFKAGYAGAPDCSADGVAAGSCGHGMGGAPISAGQTAVKIYTQPSPYPTAKLTVFVFEDDFPLNGEHDAGGGLDSSWPRTSPAWVGSKSRSLTTQAAPEMLRVSPPTTCSICR